MKNKVEFTFGADPELFLFDREKKKVVSSIPVLKRDKDNPINVKNGVKLYADNALVELAFPPAKSKKQFINTLKCAFVGAKKCLGNRYSLLPIAAHRYEEKDLKAKLSYIKDGKKKTVTAWEIGCNPNFSAYKDGPNKMIPFKNGLRSGSFHLHIGNKNYKNDFDGKLISEESKINAVRLMDIFVGVSSILFDKDKTAPLRRKLYGKAGEHRPTPYGVEYRVLGNFALRSPDLVSLVFDLTEHALSFIKSDTENTILGNINPKLVMKAINTNDKKLAIKILKSAKLPEKLFERVNANFNPNFENSWGV